MKLYITYKDSGVEWLGKIPKHWATSRMKYLCDIGTGAKDTENKEEDGEYPFFVRSQKIEKISTYSFNGEAILTAGDGVGVCKVWHYINGKFDYHQRVYKMSNFVKVEGEYLFYYLKENFAKEVMKLSAKSTVDSLRRPMFQNFLITLPPPKEQTQIANYLNHKTALLDTLIAKKEQLINLLKEERTAMINQAVTKGIDLNVRMKDSGIDWLGEIPKHWELKKLRYLGNNQNGISEGADFFGKGFPFVSYSDVFKNRVLPLNVSGLANSNEKHWSNYSVEKGDIFFTRTSETIEDIGMSSVCKNTIEKATFAGFLIRFRPHEGKLDIDFSNYYFSCFIPRVFFVKEMNLVTRASLSQELLKRLPVLVPSMEEQIEIGQYLNKKTKKIDSTLENITKQIEQLKEYKTALISEVVTGKIDVREEIIN